MHPLTLWTQMMDSEELVEGSELSRLMLEQQLNVSELWVHVLVAMRRRRSATSSGHAIRV